MISKALVRQKRFIEWVIVGVIALVTIIASATMAVVALTQEVKEAQFVNSLAQNVTHTFVTQ